MGEELAVVDGVAEIDVASHADADESTRTCGIHQGLLLIGGTYERGVAAILLDGFAVRRTELHVARAQQIFQYDLLTVGGLVTPRLTTYTFVSLFHCFFWYFAFVLGEEGGREALLY